MTGAADADAALACGADNPDAGASPFVGAVARIGQGEADAAGLQPYGADRSRGVPGRVDCSGGTWTTVGTTVGLAGVRFTSLAGFDVAGTSAALVMSAIAASPTGPSLIGFDSLDGRGHGP